MKTWLPLCVAVALVGCGEPPIVSAKESGARPQQMQQASAVAANRFVGLWTSPASQTINDWVVIFTADGLVAVDGPGLKADGSYSPEGFSAKTKYRMRNGSERVLGAEETVFKLSPDGKSLTFETGLAADAPVVLVKTVQDGDELALPSVRQAAEPRAEMNPFTLAQL